MKIVNVKSDQYAGLNNIDKNFKDGINVITGDNASGKSTLVDLIFRVLFQNVKLNGKVNKDLDFREKSFPHDEKGEINSFINGIVTLESNGEQYTLKKTWDLNANEGGSTQLIPPNSPIITDLNKINSILKEILVYGEGTYRETVFSSQRDEKHLSKIIMGADTENKNSLSDVLALDSIKKDGIQLDDIKDTISDTCLSYYNGWDLDLNRPRDKSINTSKKDKGKIFKCNAELKELIEKIEELSKSQNTLDEKQALYEKALEEVERIEKEGTDFSKYSSQKKEKETLTKEIEGLSGNLAKARNARIKWPESEKELNDLTTIQKQLHLAKLSERYEKVKALYNEYIRLKNKLDSSRVIEKSVISKLESLEKDRNRELEKLQGIGIIARYKKINEDGNISFSYISNGESFVPGKEFKIDEAVKISVPGSFELQLEKEGFDAAVIKKRLDEIDRRYAEICSEYGAATRAELEIKQKDYDELKKQTDAAKSRYESALDGKDGESKETLETLEERISILKDEEVKSYDAVMVHLEKYRITPEELPREIATCEASIRGYIESYESKEKLGEKIILLEKDLEEKQKELDKIDIPSWVDDTSEDIIAAKLNDAKKQLATATGARADAKAAMAQLDSIDELNKEKDKKEKERNDLIIEGKRWRDIETRFLDYYKQKKMAVAELQNRLVSNLARLTGDGIVMNSDIEDDLNLDLVSDGHKLDYSILSAGTEGTLDFAFRLAILEDVFKDENGFAVFDDPFVNMDPSRVEKAAELLADFAKNNQVIFVCCDPKYIEILEKYDKDLNTIDMNEKEEK